MIREIFKIILVFFCLFQNNRIFPGESENFIQPSYEKWEKIKKGFSEKEVLEVLGEPLEKENDNGGSAYEWVYGRISQKSESLPYILRFAVLFENKKVILTEDPFDGRFSKDGKPSTPISFAPKNKEVFEHYPRFTDFRWKPSSGEYPMEYDVQIEDVDGLSSPKKFIAKSTYFCLAVFGKGKWRWQVRGVNSKGIGEWSEWKFFEFKK